LKVHPASPRKETAKPATMRATPPPSKQGAVHGKNNLKNDEVVLLCTGF
jgi:hypothetical protein